MSRTNAIEPTRPNACWPVDDDSRVGLRKDIRGRILLLGNTDDGGRPGQESMGRSH